jgi:hypothetical protein
MGFWDVSGTPAALDARPVTGVAAIASRKLDKPQASSLRRRGPGGGGQRAAALSCDAPATTASRAAIHPHVDLTFPVAVVRFAVYFVGYGVVSIKSLAFFFVIILPGLA